MLNCVHCDISPVLLTEGYGYGTPPSDVVGKRNYECPDCGVETVEMFDTTAEAEAAWDELMAQTDHEPGKVNAPPPEYDFSHAPTSGII